MPQVEVLPFFHRPSGTFSYVVHDGQAAAVLDPVLDFDPAAGRTGEQSIAALDAALRERSLRLQWILETHAHADHLSGAQALKRRWPQAQVGIGAGIRRVQGHFAPLFGLRDFRSDGSQFDRLFADGERFALGTQTVQVLACPGHTPDGIAYLIGDALFPGDTLFMPDGGTARCDFPGGDAIALYRSIRRLLELPDATRVFVCHDYGPGGREVRHETTVGAQRRDNIHVHEGVSEADFVAMRTARDATLAVPALILPALRINIDAGRLPAPAEDGRRYLTLPLDAI
jgi:glyoxylase-like metal-dependent hydrolase (beta-lactamase superfamily II)